MLSAASAPRTSAVPRGFYVVTGLELFVFAGLPLVCLGLFAHFLVGSAALFDFHTFWQSGRDVLRGHSPYPTHLPSAATRTSFRPFVYPVPAAYVMAPFALLPVAIAQAIWVLLSAAAIVGALWLLGVRDWRVYGVVFIWPPVWSGLVNGSATLILAFACAALWRFRARPYVAGALVALLVIFKLYLWPLGFWLLATRRFRATLVAVAVSAAVTIASWAAIGFAGLTAYPTLISRLTSLVADQSYSPYAFARALGFGLDGARIAMLLFGGALLLAAILYSRREAGDKTGFMVAIAASLALTPIVWPHYWILLCVIVALASRELDVGWLLPLGGWFVATAWSGSAWQIGLALLVYGLTAAWAVRRIPTNSSAVKSFTPSTLRPAVK